MLEYIVAALSGGTLVQVVQLVLKRRNATAEANKTDVDAFAIHVQAVATSWKDIVQELKETINAQSNEIKLLKKELAELKEELRLLRGQHESGQASI